FAGHPGAAVRGGPDGPGRARPAGRRRAAPRPGGDPGAVGPGRPRRGVRGRGRVVDGRRPDRRGVGVTGLGALFAPRGVGVAGAGGVGRAHQADVAAVVAATGVRLLGPNTSGFLAPGRSLVASFVPGAGQIPAGRVSLVAGSGGILHAIAFLLAPAGLGLHLGVGIGNGLDVTAADVLDHLAAATAAGNCLDLTAADVLDRLDHLAAEAAAGNDGPTPVSAVL